MAFEMKAKPLYRRLMILGLFLLCMYLFLMIFPLIKDLLAVLVISIVLTYVSRPGMMYFERLGVPRVISILATFVLFIAVVVLLINSLVPVLIEEVGSLIANINQMDVEGIHSNTLNWLNERFPSAVAIIGLESAETSDLLDRIREATSGFLQQSLSLLAGAASVIVLAMVVPFLVFFMLKDGDMITRQLITKIPNRFFEMSLSLGHRIDHKLGDYIRSILIESLIIGLLAWGAFELLGVKFALVLGIINGLLNMIPFFGPLIAYVPTSLVVILTYQPVGWGLLWMAVILIGVQMLDNVLLKPLLISRSVEVHPAVVLLAVLIGGRIAGPIGMFIAVPVYSIIQVIVVDLYAHLRDYRII